MTNIMTANDLRLAGLVKFASNGEGAKTAKVTITARSGDPIDHPCWGPIQHDFAGMTSKPKIPLDYAHDPTDSIGYLNKFDTSSGDLICSGVVVVDDSTSDLIDRMTAGVPYEASIQFDPDCLLEFIPEGVMTNVNGREVQGPLTVVRQWILKAVAVCKFGADSDTSSDLMFSAKAVEQKEIESKKGFFIRMSKTNNGGKMNEKKNDQEAKVTELTAVVEAPVEAKAVETAVKTETAGPVELKAEIATEVSPIVEAVKVEEVAAEVKAEKAVETEAVELSKTADPRSEFKGFVAAFGNEKAAVYFGEGLSMSDALAKFAKAVQAENEDLKKRLSAVDRGATKPVRFSDSEAANKQTGIPIRMAGKK